MSTRATKAAALRADESGCPRTQGFECRGLEPIRWHPGEGFIVTTNGGKVGSAHIARPIGVPQAAAGRTERLVPLRPPLHGPQEFDSVDLTDDWTEYDDDANESIGVMNVKYEFRVHREKK